MSFRVLILVYKRKFDGSPNLITEFQGGVPKESTVNKSKEKYTTESLKYV